MKFFFDSVLNIQHVTFLLIFLSISFANTSFAETRLKGEILIVRDDVEYHPYEFHDKGKLTGLHIETVSAVAERLGIIIKWADLPWKRALHMVEHGQADAVTYISKTSEREKWAYFLPGNILSETSFSFLIRAESKNDIRYSGDLREILKDRTLLVISGFAMPDCISELNPRTYEAPRMENLMVMLLAKRYDLALVNKNDFSGEYKDSLREKKLLFLEPPVATLENYIAFSKKNDLQAVAEKFSEEMLLYKQTDDYKQLLHKYGMDD